MKSEIWIATKKITENDETVILFDVLDEDTNETRQERRYISVLPLMFSLGGYPASMGAMMALQELPWRFRQAGENIYLDGPGIGVPDYHPIDAVAE